MFTNFHTYSSSCLSDVLNKTDLDTTPLEDVPGFIVFCMQNIEYRQKLTNISIYHYNAILLLGVVIH